MVVAPPNFRGELKISYQNNWGGGGGDLGPEQEIKFGGELNLKLVSAIFYQIFIYHQMIALQKI